MLVGASSRLPGGAPAGAGDARGTVRLQGRGQVAPQDGPRDPLQGEERRLPDEGLRGLRGGAGGGVPPRQGMYRRGQVRPVQQDVRIRAQIPLLQDLRLVNYLVGAV